MTQHSWWDLMIRDAMRDCERYWMRWIQTIGCRKCQISMHVSSDCCQWLLCFGLWCWKGFLFCPHKICSQVDPHVGTQHVDLIHLVLQWEVGHARSHSDIKHALMRMKNASCKTPHPEEPHFRRNAVTHDQGFIMKTHATESSVRQCMILIDRHSNHLL